MAKVNWEIACKYCEYWGKKAQDNKKKKSPQPCENRNSMECGERKRVGDCCVMWVPNEAVFASEIIRRELEPSVGEILTEFMRPMIKFHPIYKKAAYQQRIRIETKMTEAFIRAIKKVIIKKALKEE